MRAEIHLGLRGIIGRTNVPGGILRPQRQPGNLGADAAAVKSCSQAFGERIGAGAGTHCGEPYSRLARWVHSLWFRCGQGATIIRSAHCPIKTGHILQNAERFVHGFAARRETALLPIVVFLFCELEGR